MAPIANAIAASAITGVARRVRPWFQLEVFAGRLKMVATPGGSSGTVEHDW
jgi:hypothetical protein